MYKTILCYLTEAVPFIQVCVCSKWIFVYIRVYIIEIFKHSHTPASTSSVCPDDWFFSPCFILMRLFFSSFFLVLWRRPRIWTEFFLFFFYIQCVQYTMKRFNTMNPNHFKMPVNAALPSLVHTFMHPYYYYSLNTVKAQVPPEPLRTFTVSHAAPF